MKIITRSQWRIMRDHAGVGKGHAKKSPGIALDDYYKAKDPPAKLKKAEALLEVFRLYCKTLATTNRGEKGLLTKIVDEIIPSIEERVKQLERYLDLLENAAKLKVAQILANRELLGLFQDFTEKDHTSENIEFILAVDKNKDHQDIYEEFISKDGRNQVNLPSQVRGELDALAADESYGEMDFNKAREEIVKLVEHDPIQRFIKTPAFKELVKEQAKLED